MNRRPVVALALALSMCVTLPVRAATLPWLAGAAAEKITPRPFDAARDAVEFPDALCPRSVFGGTRLFDHEEPYADRDGDGAFDYSNDLYCDANANGRWDGLYSSGGVDHQLEWVHDDIWARAVAISDGACTVVVESVTSQGLLIEDPLRIRNGIRQARPGVCQVYVSSTHNESSPDPIGIYGAPSLDGAAGARSGVDDYYISYLVDQAVAAGTQAVDAMRPAIMRAGEFYPADVRARLSTTFPTTDAIDGGSPARGTDEATDRKARVLQLVDASTGANIETILNIAAHNQQIGHAPDSSLEAGKRVNRAVSDDWPGVFASTLERTLGGGHAMFVVGDNGSIEDPHLNPLPPKQCRNGADDEGCFALSDSTGSALAADVANELSGSMTQVAPHEIVASISQFYVPLQNQLFVAAFSAGLFAHRTAATVRPCVDAVFAGYPCFLTEVGFLDFGPQLHMMVNPGEAYPALIEGNPFGIEDASCPERAAPDVPAWHAHAQLTMQVGLGDDLIGYEIPAPEWFADPAVTVDASCPASARFFDDPSDDHDRRDEYHKLESESVGPAGGNLVAQSLTALADAASAEPNATSSIRPGRFLVASGAFTRKGADGPAGMWVLPKGSTSFSPEAGVLVAVAGVSSFGGRPVDAHGVFMDFDGHPQAAPDIDTRGMMVTNPDGSVTRYYMDPYPALAGAPLGPAA